MDRHSSWRTHKFRGAFLSVLITEDERWVERDHQIRLDLLSCIGEQTCAQLVQQSGTCRFERGLGAVQSGASGVWAKLYEVENTACSNAKQLIVQTGRHPVTPSPSWKRTACLHILTDVHPWITYVWNSVRTTCRDSSLRWLEPFLSGLVESSVKHDRVMLLWVWI